MTKSITISRLTVSCARRRPPYPSGSPFLRAQPRFRKKLVQVGPHGVVTPVVGQDRQAVKGLLDLVRWTCSGLAAENPGVPGPGCLLEGKLQLLVQFLAAPQSDEDNRDVRERLK